MPNLGLGGRREDRFRQPVRLNEARWEPDTRDGTCRSVTLETEPGEVAAGNALYGHHVESAAPNRPTFPLWWDILGKYVIGHQIGHLTEPPQGQLRQDR